MRELFLHLGTHKTGTTSVQKYCILNNHIFPEFDLYYPKKGIAKPYIGHHNLAWELSKHPSFLAENGTVHDLFNELRSVPYNKILISSENFELCDTESLSNFIEIAKNNNFRVIPILFLRSQFSYAMSLYYTLKLYGLSLALKEYLHIILKDKKVNLYKSIWSFDYPELITKIMKLDCEKQYVIAYDKKNTSKVFDTIGKIIFPERYQLLFEASTFPRQLNQCHEIRARKEMSSDKSSLNLIEYKYFEYKFYIKFFLDNSWLYKNHNIKLRYDK